MEIVYSLIGCVVLGALTGAGVKYAPDLMIELLS